MCARGPPAGRWVLWMEMPRKEDKASGFRTKAWGRRGRTCSSCAGCRDEWNILDLNEWKTSIVIQIKKRWMTLILMKAADVRSGILSVCFPIQRLIICLDVNHVVDRWFSRRNMPRANLRKRKYRQRSYSKLTNTVLAEPDDSAHLIQKSYTGHVPVPVPVPPTSHFPSSCHLRIFFLVTKVETVWDDFPERFCAQFVS